MQGKQSRASLAWHVGDFEDTDQRNSKWAILVRQSKSSLPRVSKPFMLPKLPKKEKV